MQCVLEVLRGQAGSRIVDEAEWTSALDLAREEHVEPMVVERLLQSGVPLPDAVLERVLAARRDATITAFFWSSQLTSLLKEFAEAGIDLIPLKGPSLAERVYGGAALRACRDLDLLVRKSDYAAAESLLTRLGFTAAARPDDYHRQWGRATATVELHFDVENPLAIDFQIADAWERSRPNLFNGRPCRLLAPEDELLFLCIHGVRHRFERLSLTLDIAMALSRMPGISPRTDLDRLIQLGSAMARHLNPELNVTVAIAQMQQLADQLWGELMQAPQPTLDWQMQHAFYLETELTSASRLRRRMAHLRIALTRLIEPDFAFAARFGMQRPWQVWLLRPIRLVFARTRKK